MVIHKEGDKTRGGCVKCKKIVSATFRYAPLKYNDGSIPGILQSFCDNCGSAIGISHQSTYRIKEFRENCSHSLEFRMPPHLVDILVAIGSIHKVSQKPNLMCRLVSELYLSKVLLPEGIRVRRRILAALDDELAGGKSKDRLSCLFPDTAFNTLKTVSSQAHKNTSEIVKGIIVTAKHDLLDEKDSRLGHEFEELAAARV